MYFANSDTPLVLPDTFHHWLRSVVAEIVNALQIEFENSRYNKIGEGNNENYGILPLGREFIE